MTDETPPKTVEQLVAEKLAGGRGAQLEAARKRLEAMKKGFMDDPLLTEAEKLVENVVAKDSDKIPPDVTI